MKIRTLALSLLAVGATQVALIATTITAGIGAYKTQQINTLKNKLTFQDGLSSKEIPSEKGTFFNIAENNRILGKVQRASDSVDLSKVHKNWSPTRLSQELTTLRR